MAHSPSGLPQNSDAVGGHPVPEVHQLIRSLLALSDLSIRIAWLEERLQGDRMEIWAPVLDRLAELAQTTSKEAREALLALCILFATRHENRFIWALREEAKTQALLSLERLLRQPPPSEKTDPHSHPAEPSIPDYGAGRELTVGERRSLARRPTRLQVERLLLDPHPLVMQQLFSCPTLTEADVLTIATRRPVSLDAIRLLASTPRWVARRRVRMSLILNPGTPHGIAMPFVTTCPREDLRLIATTTTISSTLRSVAHELHSRLPPVAESSTHRYRQ